MIDAHPDFATVHESRFLVPMLQNPAVWCARGSIDVHAVVTSLYRLPRGRSRLSEMGIPVEQLLQRLPQCASDVSEAARLLYRAIADIRGMERYADKTPGYMTHMDLIASRLPEARFVHIIRDGRDVAAGLMANEFGPGGARRAALYWRHRLRTTERLSRSLPGRYLEVRYEDLVTDAEVVLKDICAFLDADYHPIMLRFHERGEQIDQFIGSQEHHGSLRRPLTVGLRDWREDLSIRDQKSFFTIAGDVLAEQGYEVTSSRRSFRAPLIHGAYAVECALRVKARRLADRALVRRRDTSPTGIRGSHG